MNTEHMNGTTGFGGNDTAATEHTPKKRGRKPGTKLAPKPLTGYFVSGKVSIAGAEYDFDVEIFAKDAGQAEKLAKSATVNLGTIAPSGNVQLPESDDTDKQ